MGLKVHVYPIMRMTVEVPKEITDPREAVEFAIKATDAMLPEMANRCLASSDYPVVDAGYADDYDSVPCEDGGMTPLVVVDEVSDSGEFIREIVVDCPECKSESILIEASGTAGRKFDFHTDSENSEVRVFTTEADGSERDLVAIVPFGADQEAAEIFGEVIAHALHDFQSEVFK